MARPSLRRFVDLLTRTVRTGKPVRAVRRPARAVAAPWLEDRTLPSTVSWVNPSGGDWGDATN
jgi:hypothetical protein